MSLPLTWADKINSPSLADFIEKHGAEYCMTAEEINEMRDAVNEMAVIQQSTFMGTAEPSDTPTGTGNRYWTAVSPGTYTNFGGVVVGANSLAIISVTAGGVYSVSQAGFNLNTYLKIVDGNKINPFVDQAYPINSQVNSLGKDWYNTSATAIGEIPGTSSKWISRLTAYENKVGLEVISNNLGDKTTVSTSTYTDGNSSGNLIYSADKFTTDFIQIEAGLTYFLSNVSAFTSYWNGSKIFVSGGTRNVGITQFTPPVGAIYIKLTFGNEYLNTFQINKGSLKSYDAYAVGLPSSKMNFSELTTNQITDIKTKPYLKSILTRGENKVLNSTLDNGLTPNQEIVNDGANILPSISVVSGVKDILDNNVFNISHLRSGTTMTGIIIRNLIPVTPSASNNLSCSFLFYGDLTKIDFFMNVIGYLGGISGTNLGTIASVGLNDLTKIDVLANGWSRMYLTNVVPQATADTVSFLIRSRVKITAPDGVVQTCYMSSPYLHLSSLKAFYTYNALDLLVPEMLVDQRFINGTSQSPYAVLSGKKWTSYGDSITAANNYQPKVLNKITGLSHYLRGIGGTTVIEQNQIAWVDNAGLYLNRPPALQPAGSTQILSSMSNQERINTIPLDTNIITIFGGANDSGNNTLGTISDTGVTTFYGAYQTMLNRIYARIPNAEVILVTTTYRQGEETPFTNPGQTFEQYREAIRLIGQKYKYRVIEMNKSGINYLNSATYLTDVVHPNDLGAERMSRLFLQEFKNIY